MTINEHADTFAGYPVKLWKQGHALANAQNTIYRISIDFGDENQWTGKFDEFLSDPASVETPGLVVGNPYTEAPDIDQLTNAMEAVVAASTHFNNLKALFFCDLICEESEISWIDLMDVSPFFTAYPKL